jgi:hypothetical protein
MLCDTVDETTFGFLVPAASYLADQERIWQRHQIPHHLSAPLKRKEDSIMARPLHASGKLVLQTLCSGRGAAPASRKKLTKFEKYAPLDSVNAKRYNNGSITPNKFRGDACFEQ